MFSTTKLLCANSVLAFSLLALIIVLASCGSPSQGPTSGNTPEQMFEALIQSPLPPEVTNLEGTGDTWQGHSIYLRFQADPAFLEAYTADEFEAVPCETILSYFNLPHSSYDVFDPPWEPGSIDKGTCYRSKGLVGEMWLGEQFILWDTVTNTVYFYGVGD